MKLIVTAPEGANVLDDDATCQKVASAVADAIEGVKQGVVLPFGWMIEGLPEGGVLVLTAPEGMDLFDESSREMQHQLAWAKATVSVLRDDRVKWAIIPHGWKVSVALEVTG